MQAVPLPIDPLKNAFAELERLSEDLPDLAYADPRARTIPESALRFAPLAAGVETLLRHAYQSGASEVQIVPEGRAARARFRIDGFMHDILRYPVRLHALIVARLKRMARLRADEHLAAQEGRIRGAFENEAVDLRFAVVPVVDGEKVVLRLPVGHGRMLGLESVGLSEAQLETLRRAMRKPSGAILAVGPADSGRTSTLYAMLGELDASRLDIATLEDPIECDLAGVCQIQVDPGSGITFAAGLRAMGRPSDVLMIGEIRDVPTADLAFDAAKAGRLTLSSLEASDAASGLTRLRDLGLDPSRIASSVGLVIGERLVRRICPHCARSGTLDLREAKARGVPDVLIRRSFGVRKSVTVLFGGKCARCRFTGYQGRIGLFELLEVGEPIKALLSRGAGADEIRSEAARQGMTPLLEDGIRKVLEGLTTLDELLRATRDA